MLVRSVAGTAACSMFAESTEIVSVEEVFAGLAEIETQYRSVSRQCLSSKLFLSAAS